MVRAAETVTMGENITENELLAKPADEKTAHAAPQKVTLEVGLPAENDIVVCEVCGYQNPKNAAMCAMCSNYLI